MAIETNDLINEYKENDNINNNVGTSLEGSGILDDCPCINVLKCNRTKELAEKVKQLSKLHPERKTFILYLRSLICDKENQGVRCCGVNTDRDTPQKKEPVFEDEKISKESII